MTSTINTTPATLTDDMPAAIAAAIKVVAASYARRRVLVIHGDRVIDLDAVPDGGMLRFTLQDGGDHKADWIYADEARLPKAVQAFKEA